MNNFADAHNLPSRDDLVAFRIWDNHFHGFSQMEAMVPYIERMGIERLFSLGVGGWDVDDPETQAREKRDREMLEEWRHLVYGVIIIDPSRPEASVAKINRWIANGPCVGIKYAGGNEGGVTCDHPNNDPIIARAAELDATIYIHASYEVGGSPPHIGGGNRPGESTPDDVVTLAKRFPDVEMICGHAGADWELGTRAVRSQENVLLEFSGMDPWSGAVEFAVNELGDDRIVWGGHIPSRSYSNELAKVFDAGISDEARFKILGANLRRLAAAILKKKKYDFKP